MQTNWLADLRYTSSIPCLDPAEELVIFCNITAFDSRQRTRTGSLPRFTWCFNISFATVANSIVFSRWTRLSPNPSPPNQLRTIKWPLAARYDSHNQMVCMSPRMIRICSLLPHVQQAHYPFFGPHNECRPPFFLRTSQIRPLSMNRRTRAPVLDLQSVYSPVLNICSLFKFCLST